MAVRVRGEVEPARKESQSDWSASFDRGPFTKRSSCLVSIKARAVVVDFVIVTAKYTKYLS